MTETTRPDEQRPAAAEAAEARNAPSVEGGSNGSEAAPCSRCNSTEPPDELGRCRTCRCFRVGNSASTIHGGRAKFTRADLDARDALMERLFHERGGREALDIVSQLRIEDYATAQIQLAARGASADCESAE